MLWPELQKAKITTSQKLSEALIVHPYHTAIVGGDSLVLERTDFSARIAYVDYDGAKVFDAYQQQTPKTHSERTEFVQNNAPKIVAGLTMLEKFFEALKRDAVEWSPPKITIEETSTYQKDLSEINLEGGSGTFTISFNMKFLQPMQTTDVWVQGTDRSGNFFKVSLPLTLKVAGNEPLVFESKVNQKVLGFYDESMLNDVVSDWTGSTQDVSELAAILGIPDEQLPPWVANLALWVSEDRISMGDMIVSIEHLINN